VSLATQEILHLLAVRPATVVELAEGSGRSVPQVRYMLSGLLEAGRVTRERPDGRTYRYRQTD
jgi:predicted transcriptional regulator